MENVSSIIMLKRIRHPANVLLSSTLIYRTIIESPSDRTRKPDATIRRGSQTETRANTRRSTAKPYARSASASKSLSLLRSGKSESGNDCFVIGVGIPFRLENYIEIFAAKYCSTVRSIFSFEPCFKTVRENIIV